MTSLLDEVPAAMAETRAFDLLRVHVYQRGPGTLVPSPREADGAEWLVLVLSRAAGSICSAGRVIAVPAHTLCFLPHGRLDLSGFDDGGVVLVELPGTVQARPTVRFPAVLGRTIPATSGASAFLRSFVETLGEQLSDYRPDHPAWVQSCVCDMAERVLAECGAPSLSSAERDLQVAQDFIRSHLADIDLAPLRVAREANVSLRTLNRLFAHEGGVGGWIRRRRLDRCRADLIDPVQAERSIGQIAATWGFVDAPHFSRVFKEAFGCSPRSYRASAASAHGQTLGQTGKGRDTAGRDRVA